MDEALRAVLYDNAETICRSLAKNGSFAINDAADRLVARLDTTKAEEWKQIQEHFAHQGVLNYLNKVIAQAKAADPAQRRLPGLESMPLLITSEGAAILSEQLVYNGYKIEEKRLERKIKSYKYKRRTPENLEEDLKRLAEMKTFSPRFARYSKENPELTLEKAKEIEAAEVKARKWKKPGAKKKTR